MKILMIALLFIAMFFIGTLFNIIVILKEKNINYKLKDLFKILINLLNSKYVFYLLVKKEKEIKKIIEKSIEINTIQSINQYVNEYSYKSKAINFLNLLLVTNKMIDYLDYFYIKEQLTYYTREMESSFEKQCIPNKRLKKSKNIEYYSY